MGRKFLSSIRKRFQNRSESPNPEPPNVVTPISSVPTPLQSASTPPLLSSSPTIEQIRQQIWNAAYEKAKQEEPRVVDAYEKILSAYLAAKNGALAVEENVENNIARDADTRNAQMKQLVELGLAKTEKEINWKRNLNNSSSQLVANANKFLTGVSKVEPTASVAWAGVITCIEIISNPLSEPGINRDGIRHVLERLEWYWELAKLLLNTDEVDQSVPALQSLLKEHIINLNQKLLLYQMQSVCVYNKSRSAVIAKDAFKLCNWQEKIDSIKKAEDLIRQDINQHDSEVLKACLRSIESTTTHLVENVKAISSGIRDQTTAIRQIHHDENDQRCLRGLYILNPLNHKKTIENTKGGLLKDSYCWILEHDDFRKFMNSSDNKLLWIKGDLGKGKTMLLCGLIDEIEKNKSRNIAYFFCQATQVQQLRNSTAVLRSLIWLLCVRQSRLISHIRQRYDLEGKDLFQNISAFSALSDILIDMLQDPCFNDTTFIIDALDECTESSRAELIGLIVELSASCNAKWIVSSRNWPSIEEQFQVADKMKISLELNKDTISQAVDTFIENKVEQLTKKKHYDAETKKAILDTLHQKANDTFLWVALVCAELARPEIRSWNTMEKLNSIPAGLSELYERILEQIFNSDNGELCRHILATACVAFRLLGLEELHLLVTELKAFTSSQLEEIIGECGSFLTVQDGFVYFVHQSAQDFLLENYKILPSGVLEQHRILFRQSLALMEVLKRDIYHLESPGALTDEVLPPQPDPLAGLQYCCCYWIDHVEQLGHQRTSSDNDDICNFIKNKLLHWLEALSLQRKIPDGVNAVQKLKLLTEVGSPQPLKDLVEDVRRFVLSYKHVLEIAPLQVYTSGLLFSPTNSQVKELFKDELPNWITLKSEIPKTWDTCVQTLEGHRDVVRSVTFLPDGQYLASGSKDETVRIWDAALGHCTQILKIQNVVTAIAPLLDGLRIIVGLRNGQIQLWDISSATCLRSTQAHEDEVNQIVFSPNGNLLASCSSDGLIKLWDPTISNCAQTMCDSTELERIASVSFSPNSLQLAAVELGGVVTVWDTTTSHCIRILGGDSDWLYSVVFLTDSLLVSGGEGSIKVWDVQKGVCTKMLKLGNNYTVRSLVVLSLDEQLFASGSDDAMINVWSNEGDCVQTFKGHGSDVRSLAYSAPRRSLVSASFDKTLKIWDLAADSNAHNSGIQIQKVECIASSPDGRLFASALESGIVKVWLTADATCIKTFMGHNESTRQLDFSSNGQFLVLRGFKTVMIWDIKEWICIRVFAEVDEATFSPNRQLLAMAFCLPLRFIIYDTFSQTILQKFENGYRFPVFSLDNFNLALFWRGKIRTYDTISTGQEIQCLEYQTDDSDSDDEQTYFNHRPEGLSSITLSEDSKALAVSTRFQVQVWDLKAGTLIHRFNFQFTRKLLTVALNSKWLVYHSNKAHHIRDMITGTLIKSINDVKVTKPPHFDSHTGSLLYTRYGTVQIRENSVSRIGYGLSFDNMWIIRDNERLVRLPPRYRPFDSMVLGSKVVLACSSGDMLIVDLSTCSM